jgi:FkbM family methyltransferase
LIDPGSLSSIHELTIGSTLSRLIASLSRDCDLFIDVGANQGIYSAIAARSLRNDAEVIAIEPQLELADCIERTLAASSLRRWRVLKTAVGDRPGIASLVIPSENQGEAHVGTTGSQLDGAVQTPVTLLDDILSETREGANVVIKMDIEGSELAALRGGAAFIRRCLPILVMELNPEAMARYGQTAADMAQALIGFGYGEWAPIEQPTEKRSLGTLPSNYCDIVVRRANA